MDLDMWYSRSDFTAQSSAWSGLATVSGPEFMSKGSSRAGGFRRSNPGLRRWQSMYHLEPESPPRSFSPSGAELWIGRGKRRFEQAEGVPWLQRAQEWLNTEPDWLRTREITPGYNKTMAQMLDMEQKEKNNFTTEVSILREALKDAEARATTLQEERNKALQDLQTSAEMQKMVISQMEEMKKRVSDATQGHSEVQRLLREANSQISQACLDKAVLSTQVLKLEDNVKELNTKLTDALSAEDDLKKKKEDLLHKVQDLEVQLNKTKQGPQSFEIHDIFSHPEYLKETKKMNENSKVNEQLRRELEVIMKQLAASQQQLQELNEERHKNLRQITDLKAERSQLLREKEELLSKRNQGGNDALNEPKENSCQHSASVEDFELENQKLRNQCLRLEEMLREKKEKLQLQEEKYHNKDEMRILRIKELEDMASHWTEKWQKVALTLQSTQDELEELKTNYNISKTGSESLLRSRFEACKQQEGGVLVQTFDKETQTDFSESFFTSEPPSDSPCNGNKSPQMWRQSGEVERLKQKLAETEREVTEREHDLRTLERLREMERTEAQIWISALKLKLLKKVSGDCHNVWTDVSNPASIHEQQESRERSDKTQQPNSPVLHKHPTKRQTFSLGKNEKPCVQDKKNKTICPVNPEVEQQRKMVTEQLKSLFKEREGKEARRSADSQAAAHSGSSSPQDWTSTSLVVRAEADRRNRQQGSALMPVLEEDEENSDWAGVEEGDA
ncbi:hypothetical protein AMECASPLE_000217 [Ameca splendens]|uniref:Uncharacterized protein n=1 Tax=Ameca splendens TaxID=208324 RepID=A0ABV0XXK3_9TELE